METLIVPQRIKLRNYPKCDNENHYFKLTYLNPTTDVTIGSICVCGSMIKDADNHISNIEHQTYS